MKTGGDLKHSLAQIIAAISAIIALTGDLVALILHFLELFDLYDEFPGGR